MEHDARQRRPKAAESAVARIPLHVRWLIRDRFPRRRVVRDVQGVRLSLPWSHRLPDYVKLSPDYGQNLVRLAALLGAGGDKPLTVLDVGANVGDSARQILHATPARILCVEADDYYREFLERNVAGHPQITIEPSFLSVDDDVAAVAVRVGGTTRFESGNAANAPAVISPSELRRRHADFTELRLVKSDTDGYDVVLVPAIVRAWADSLPVLFLEYDHAVARHAGNDPLALWPALAEFGYSQVGVWDNFGERVGLWDVAELPSRAAALDLPNLPVARRFWDVAVVHGDDNVGCAALLSLFGDTRRSHSAS